MSNARGHALGGLDWVVLGAGRIVGRGRMPECMSEPWKQGQVSNLIHVPKVMGDKPNIYSNALLELEFCSPVFLENLNCNT